MTKHRPNDGTLSKIHDLAVKVDNVRLREAGGEGGGGLFAAIATCRSDRTGGRQSSTTPSTGQARVALSRLSAVELRPERLCLLCLHALLLPLRSRSSQGPAGNVAPIQTL